MKVQTKLILLLTLIVLAFVSAIVAAKFFENAKFERINAARAGERTKSFDEFLQRHGEPLETLVNDQSAWDQLVRALAMQDRDWIAANLGDSPLTAYHANAIWIFKRDLSPFY